VIAQSFSLFRNFLRDRLSLAGTVSASALAVRVVRRQTVAADLVEQDFPKPPGEIRIAADGIQAAAPVGGNPDEQNCGVRGHALRYTPLAESQPLVHPVSPRPNILRGFHACIWSYQAYTVERRRTTRVSNGLRATDGPPLAMPESNWLPLDGRASWHSSRRQRRERRDVQVDRTCAAASLFGRDLNQPPDLAGNRTELSGLRSVAEAIVDNSPHSDSRPVIRC
jgi:hypothetical protein